MSKLDIKNVEDIIELIPMQQALLLQNIKNLDSDQYFEQLSLDILNSLNFEIFEEAWKLVVESNEMMRTVFRWEGIEKPIQAILRSHKVDIRYVDYSIKSEIEISGLVENLKIKDREEKFNLTEVPFRITLCKINEKKYVMIISNHHIIYDGWSNGIILNEFLYNYNTIAEGKACKPFKKNNFKNFVKWTQAQDIVKSEEYWRQYLNGLDIKTELPIKKKVNTQMQFAEEYKFNIKKQDVEKFVKETRITIATLIYTAWGILLQRYNDNEDVIFGTTVSGRNAKLTDIDSIVGLFINTLPMRVKTNENDTIKDLLYKVKCDLELREEYEFTPLTNIKKCSELDNRDELFDSIVVIENYPLDSTVLKKEGKISFDSYSMFELNNFNITLGVTLFEDIEISFNYNKEVFEYEDIKALGQHFNLILLDMINNPNKMVKDVEILSNKEKTKIIYEFNDTKMDYQNNKTINCLFEEQVKKTPDNIALICGDKQLTYKELNQKSNQLAKLLVKMGVKKDSVVGIMAERSIEMIISIMATLKAGGAYLPVDPQYPYARKQYLFDDSKVNTLITQKKLIEINKLNMGEYPLENIIFADDEKNYTENSDDFDVYNEPSDLMYVIYTSGTTGKPKGVMVEHRNMVAYMEAYFKLYEITSQDATIHLVPFSFDLFGEELFLALLKGGKFIIPKENEFRDMNKLYDLIVKNNVSIVSCSPLLLNEFNKFPKMKSVHTFVNGGDVLKEEYINNLLDYSKVFNGYGPAETTIGATHHRVVSSDSEASISIGKPMKNYKIYVLDKNKKLLPIGVPGEMYIGGDGVARGYLNNIGLTNEKFMDDPFFQQGRMYKTGDIVKWRRDGNIDFIGRVDEQVKIRGFRIELGEIENQLQEHKNIEGAVVLANETKQGNKYLCAYIVSDKEIEKDELVKFLSKELPDYMIPVKFIKIDSIPLTVNGKVDKKKLLQIFEVNDDTNKNIILPRDDIEKKIVDIWSEILEMNSISIYDDFFEIGGDSLTLIRVYSAVNKEFPESVTMQDLFDYRQCNQLADLIKKKLGLVNKEKKIVNIEF